METEIELIDIGIGLLDSFQAKKSIDFFSRAIQLNSTNPKTFELRGIAFFRIFDILAALNDTSKAIDLDPLNHNAWFNKGEIFKHTKEFEEAEYCYVQANNINPDSFVYLNGLIVSSNSLRKYNKVIEFCNQILIEFPADDFALYYRGNAYSKLLNYEFAIKDFLKLIETGKRTSTNYNNLGYWYSKIGELRKADNNLSVSIQLNQHHPYALNNLGYVKYLQKDFSNALDLINSSIEINPSNSYAYKNRALVYLEMGEINLAREDLEKARLLGFNEDYGNEVDKILELKFRL